LIERSDHMDGFTLSAASRNKPRSGFAYAGVADDAATELRNLAAEIRHRSITDMIEIGNLLLHAKDHLPHGQFGPWLEAEDLMSKRTAQRRMAMATMAAKSDTVTLLPLSIAYRLSAPSTPDPIRDEILASFAAGERLNAGEIRQRIDQAKPVRPRRSQAAAMRSNVVSLDPGEISEPVALPCTGDHDAPTREDAESTPAEIPDPADFSWDTGARQLIKHLVAAICGQAIFIDAAQEAAIQGLLVYCRLGCQLQQWNARALPGPELRPSP
jgi:hypothetical protein